MGGGWLEVGERKWLMGWEKFYRWSCDSSAKKNPYAIL